MKTLLECKSMDHAGELHNSLQDNLFVPEGMGLKIQMVHDRSGNLWNTGWFVSYEYYNRQEKAPLQGEAVSRGD